MQRCLDLARNGAGMVNPNPMVGCVIVRNGKIVGEGFHKQFGGPHAEIFAIMQAGRKTRGSTLFVNLEPCAHFGKTPPCADAVVKAGISKAVIASKDPNPLTNGKGIKRLREAGISVKTGVMQKEAELLNEKFFKFLNKGVPFVGIKLAQTIDGRIADRAGTSKWITSGESRTEAHRLRSEYDAIMVGANTVKFDDPELTVRLAGRRNPVRIVVDGFLSLTADRKIFNTKKSPTWILTSDSAVKKNYRKIQKLIGKGVRVLAVSSSTELSPDSILDTLAAEGISSVLLEGGASLVAPFIKQSLADILYLFTAPKILGGGLDGIKFKDPYILNRHLALEISGLKRIKNDILIEARFIKKQKSR
ncbi:MAG: bifunctional diaminohydroxyphosphoribosylaminopyrimidine deaminase/5-amino-6-(5-phosphoribosylamino)uracil reductase RibD [Bacteroidetes bacterium]|nr:bifunctional diaminohydroxyphosphoribosylaminopyrimidine deaminase/5-amino-6-(5-phosphoribosylamino)uracil reductase RibD [Bacteroidota bacterium]